jgi:hypothetical protein
MKGTDPNQQCTANHVQNLSLRSIFIKLPSGQRKTEYDPARKTEAAI